MPFTIEMEINTTITAFQFGGASALEDRALPNSVDTVQAAVRRPVIRSTDVLEKTAAIRTTIANASPGPERTVSLAEGKAFQATLCVAPTGDFGPAGTTSETRVELKAFNIAYLYPTDSQATDTIANSAQLGYLRRAQKAFPSCEGAQLMNGFEVGILSRIGFPTLRTRVAKALTANGLSAAGIEAGGAAMDKPLRDAIKELGKKFSPQAPTELDRAFYAWIMTQLER